MVDGDRIYGLAVDIWERIAARNQIPFKFKRYNTVKALLKATEDGDIDLAVTNLTITNKRAKRVDFTQPWFEGGTRFLVRQHDDTGFMAIIKGMYEQGYLKVYAFLGGVILIATLLFTLFDRRFDPAFPKRWRDGAAESFYTVMQVVTSGHPPSRKNLFGWLGRIWQGIWLACGIAIVAFVTSTVTSVMTSLTLSSHIANVRDLSNEPVAILTGSIQQNYAYSLGLNAHQYTHMSEAGKALINGDVRAVMADAAVLSYYVKTHPKQPVKTSGRIYKHQRFGFALPRHSPLTYPISLHILRARDTGRVRELKARYLGTSS